MLNRYIHFCTHFCLVSDDQSENVYELFILGAKSRKMGSKWAGEHLVSSLSFSSWVIHYRGRSLDPVWHKGDGLWTWLTCFKVEGLRKPGRPVVSPMDAKSRPFLQCAHHPLLLSDLGPRSLEPVSSKDRQGKAHFPSCPFLFAL